MIALRAAGPRKTRPIAVAGSFTGSSRGGHERETPAGIAAPTLAAMLSLLTRTLGRDRTALHVINRCPGCGRPVLEGEARVRLRADWYAHRRCATYNVRRLNALGRDRAGRPLRQPALGAAPPFGTD